MLGIEKLMQQAKELQEKMATMEKNMATWQETGTAGAGGEAVRVTLDGKGMVVTVEIDDALLSPAQKIVLTDLIKTATNQASEKIKKRVDAERSELFGNIPMPPGFKLPF
ncbi:MAG: YbaB/EbfC family nucleoid-associated protein [Hydrotalea sp.]|nr:YbaB/EbfC family nucleoid-associated protein [Hydrotalea sp.]